MRKKSFLTIAVCALSAATLVGCSGKPSGFPRVHPCEITVLNDGAGIADVEVALVPAKPISGVVAGGKTDASGKCVVKTTFANHVAPGVPEGEFTVTLRKDPEPSKPALTVDEMADMERSEIDKYNAERDAEMKKMPQIIPPNLTSASTSSLKVSAPGDSKKEIDVAEYK